MKATKIARSNQLYWCDSKLFLEKSKQKFLFMMKNPQTTRSFCSNMFNKLNRFHQNRLSKFCKEAVFMHVLEVRQHFVTRDAGEFQQTVACREYTLPRDDKASQPKGWIRGNMRIGPVLKVTTSFQHFKYGIEIRIESVNKDNSHSWVPISYGTVKYVNDYITDDRKSCRFTRRGRCTNNLRSGCSQVESKSKTSTEGIYWRDNHPTK